jgi:hypothetical protein
VGQGIPQNNSGKYISIWGDIRITFKDGRNNMRTDLGQIK